VSNIAHLVLADGTVFEGEAFGAQTIAVGEAVFTTTMTGYEEVLSDPSYYGQLVTMTVPEIGNVGITEVDSESLQDKPQVAGFIVRHLSPVTSNWRSKLSLDDHLKQHNIAGITEIDTRKLTRHLRDHGSQNAAFGAADPAELLQRAKAAKDMQGADLVQYVTPKATHTFTEGRGTWQVPMGELPAAAGERKHVVAMDFGAKRNIFRCLVDAGCRLTVVPATASPQEILALGPDGIFLSNGPGDPAAVTYAIETIRALLGKKPIFGICLGHQLLALALGAKTFKLKFGHRGGNQPVKNLLTGKVEITTQNHGFCVDLATLPKDARSTHVHLNDGTSEGIAVDSLRAFSVQYHPEAAAGPHDSLYLFAQFARMMSN
jgi:carbamoyl-phosphate synthase small subunit